MKFMSYLDLLLVFVMLTYDNRDFDITISSDRNYIFRLARSILMFIATGSNHAYFSIKLAWLIPVTRYVKIYLIN